MVKIRWEIEERSQRAYLGSILITELGTDPEDLDQGCSWYPRVYLESDEHYDSYDARNFQHAKADIEAYVVKWLEAAGLVQKEVA